MQQLHSAEVADNSCRHVQETVNDYIRPVGCKGLVAAVGLCKRQVMVRIRSVDCRVLAVVPGEGV